MSFLHDRCGNRKYLTIAEREAFLQTVQTEASVSVTTFCAVLAYTGARLSEVLALTPGRIDFEAEVIVIRCLKKRRQTVFRAIPVPKWLLDELDSAHALREAQHDPKRVEERIWHWCRTMGWAHVKEMMTLAGISGPQATAKGLRHGFAIACLHTGVPLTSIRRWLGHARLETTAVYTEAVGKEERDFAEKLWGSFGKRPRSQ